MSVRLVSLLLATAFLIGGAWLAAPAQAAFPGANGKIAYSTPYYGGGMKTINPDGSGATVITSGCDGGSSWSADGLKIAFERVQGDCSSDPAEIWTMNTDGSGQTRLTNNSVADSSPTWSPDGTKIVFQRSSHIWTMNADGTGQIATGQSGDFPAWSPDGQKIAFNVISNGASSIYTMNPDGTGSTLVRNPSPFCIEDCYSDYHPRWSPDGQRIAFLEGDPYCLCVWLTVMNANGSNPKGIAAGGIGGVAWSPDGKRIATSGYVNGLDPGIYTMNPDGSDLDLTFLTADGVAWDWQPLPTRSYAHPQSASPLSVSLVRAFRQCGIQSNPIDGRHSPPLGTQACLPPVPGSTYVRVGPDSQGSASFTVVPGDTDPTNGDQADLTLAASLSDLQTSTGADYLPNASGPDMTAITRLRITDKKNNYGGASGTTTESDFRVPLECAPTSDPAIGSTCSANTSADALLPGYITEQRQTVIQAFRVRVDDAGANGTTGDSDDRIFATQGIYIP